MDKILVDGEIVEIQSQVEGVALEGLQITRLFRFHLPVEDLHAGQFQRVGGVKHLFDGIFLRLKVPIGIAGGAKAERGGGHSERSFR
jgi:hypothetical protein